MTRNLLFIDAIHIDDPCAREVYAVPYTVCKIRPYVHGPDVGQMIQTVPTSMKLQLQKY